MKKLAAFAILVAILVPLFASQAHACGMGQDGDEGSEYQKEKAVE